VHHRLLAEARFVHEGRQPQLVERGAVLGVHLEIEDIVRDEGEKKARVIQAPAAEHRLRLDGAEGAHGFQHVLDEFVAGSHGPSCALNSMSENGERGRPEGR
jgi:hypothetical protein